MNAPRSGNVAERKRRLRMRNLALAAALLAFVVIVYLVSIVRMGGE
ncbi:MAG: hypothetical protein WD044_06300 [Dongiaceae bacterium]